jgi:hypothetical protein
MLVLQAAGKAYEIATLVILGTSVTISGNTATVGPGPYTLVPLAEPLNVAGADLNAISVTSLSWGKGNVAYAGVVGSLAFPVDTSLMTLGAPRQSPFIQAAGTLAFALGSVSVNDLTATVDLTGT